MVAQRHGKIILITSVSGLFGLRGQATYAAAKCAVVGLMRILALEGAEHDPRRRARSAFATATMRAMDMSADFR